MFGRNQLGDDADRDFLRRDGAYVEADRRVDAPEQVGGEPLVEQGVKDALDLRFAPDEPQVPQGAGRQRAQRKPVLRLRVVSGMAWK